MQRKLKAKPDLITLFGIHQKKSKTLSSNNYLKSFTQNQSKLPRNHTMYLTKHTIFQYTMLVQLQEILS